jgi:hypothetical protein
MLRLGHSVLLVKVHRMMRIYLATFEDVPRTESRVMRIFDHQGISVASFTAMRADGKIRMRILADAGVCGESRLTALLLHLEGACGVRSLGLEAEDAGELLEMLMNYYLQCELILIDASLDAETSLDGTTSHDAEANP